MRIHKLHSICAGALFCLFIISCNKDEKNDTSRSELTLAFSVDDPRTTFLHDSVTNRIYCFTPLAKSEIVSYDYEQKKVLLRVSKNLEESLNDREVALGVFDGIREIYIGHNRNIIIYNADNLSKKDSIVQPDTVNFLRFTTFANLQDSFLIATCCGSKVYPVLEPRSRVFNRRSKSMIPSGNFADVCTDMKAYSTVNQFGEKEYGVLSNILNSSDLQFSLERYDKNGNNIDAKYSFYTWETWLLPLGVSNESPYIIVGKNLYSKQDLSFIGSLSGEIVDYYITPSGGKIYGFTLSGTIEVYNYPSLVKEKTIRAPIGAGGSIAPSKLYHDGQNFIEIFKNGDSVMMYIVKE